MQGKVEICGVNTASLPRLSGAETEALLREARAGDAQAREKLIQGNLRLVLSVIQRFGGRGEIADDLFQVGCVGLIKAVDNFDPKHEVRFSTYGVPTIIEWGKQESEGFPMTRKEALRLAIQALSEAGQQEEAIEVLHTLTEELPLNRWSDAAIRDSIEQFILDHGRVPNVKDFKKRGLPPHTVIRNKYGVNLSEWLRENYPAVRESEERKRAEATERFIRDYLRIQPKSAEEYDKNRSPESRCWYTVARCNQTRTWRALLSKLELPVFNYAAAPKTKREYYVQFDARLDEMQQTQRDTLRQMVEEHGPTFPTPNFRVIVERDEKDASKEHFVLRYVTDKRLAYEATAASSEKTATSTPP